MKNQRKLQAKLLKILKGTPALNILPPCKDCWTLEEWKEIEWIVQNFLNKGNNVIECDPLVDWLHELNFMLHENESNFDGWSSRSREIHLREST